MENLVAWSILLILWGLFIVAIVIGLALLVHFIATITGIKRMLQNNDRMKT